MTTKARLLLIPVICTLLQTINCFAGDTLITPFATSWKYLDNGSDQGSAWQTENFDDTSWNSGSDELGYGDGDESTVVNGGPVGARYITTYFRHTFNVANPNSYQDLQLDIKLDDGAVVYLNGSEIFRHNMPAGTINYDTLASAALENQIVSGNIIAASNLHNGINTIAVEIHQVLPSSSDIGFALQLIGNFPPVPFERGPYLQILTPDSVIIRWGTSTASDSKVNYGTAANNLSSSVSNGTLTTTHEIKLENLTPASTYYYNVGSTTKVQSSGIDHFFKTQPPVGNATPTRLWVIGDSGRYGSTNQRAIYDGYFNNYGSTYTDLWLMLGDNAYNDGTDDEYQAAFFNVYQTLMHQTVVWPTLGNHDTYTTDPVTQAHPYYNIFTLPSAGEALGLPAAAAAELASGTEAYYAYNYGNIHFVVLESTLADRNKNAAMASWLKKDLAAATADWIIAYWHHPPYTKGSHDSDFEIELIEMRENILPILESYGVDLVLTGHSHSYERSMFLHDHYESSNTFDINNHTLDRGGGDANTGDTAYTKFLSTLPRTPSAPNGTVYVVAGTSAYAGGSGALDYPAMYFSAYMLGSMIIDIDNLNLSARFIDDSGAVHDKFTIQKLNQGSDQDGDGIANSADNCPQLANLIQLDSDLDTHGDACDAFPLDVNEWLDSDYDHIGNQAEWDDDNDGVPDAVDAAPLNYYNNSEVPLPLNAAYKGLRFFSGQNGH